MKKPKAHSSPKKHTQAKAPKHHGSSAKPKKHSAGHAGKLHKSKPAPKKTAHKPSRAKASAGSAVLESYLPDTIDGRDYIYDAPSCAPEFVDLAHLMPPVWDQGDEGSCVAHAALAVHMYALAKAGRQSVASAARVYWDARTLEGVAGDVGTQVRTAVKACTTGADTEYLTLEPHALQACLSEGYPALMGLNLYDGSHCMAAVGIGYGYQWATQFPEADAALSYVKLRNSWGTDTPHLLMPTTYINTNAADLWTIRCP